MGRKTNMLLRGFRAAKCLTQLKLVTARIKVQKNKRSASAKQMRGEIAQLLKAGQDAHVYITKADALIKQENMVAVYDLVEQYCNTIISRFPAIEMQRNCPIDVKEAIASIIFAAPRCVELSELPSIREAFLAKYGKDFVAAAAELRPDCGVNRQVIELLSTRPATGEMKFKLMKEICVEYHVQWTPSEALGESSTTPAVGSSQQHVKAKVEAIRIPGDAGSNKATLVEAAPLKVGEAGPSNIDKQTPLQGGSKHAASTKLGLAAVESLKTGNGGVFVSSASKTSNTKLKSSSKEDVGKDNASVFQSLHTETASGKFGLPTVESSKAVGGAVLATDASEIHDSKYSSFANEDVERLNARIFQSLKGAMDTGTSSSHGSFNELKGESEAKADVHVEPVVDAQDGMSDSDSDSFVSFEEGRLEEDLELSPVSAGSRRESFAKNSVQDFEEANVDGPSLSKKTLKEDRESSSSTETLKKDVYSRASSKNSSLTIDESSFEDMSHRASSENGLNTEALLEEKSFRTESRKSSLRRKELAEEQSFIDVKENILMKETVAEEESLEAVDEEVLQRNDILEDVSFGAITESSGTQKLVEEDPSEASRNKTITEELSDEGDLQSIGVIEDAPVVEITERLVMEKLVEEYPLEASQNKMTTEEMSSLSASDMQKTESFSDKISAEEMSSGAGEETCWSNEKLPVSVMDHMSGVPSKEASMNLDSSPKILNNQMGGVPAVEKRLEDILGSSSSGALATSEYSNDFATTAKAIAEEAARKAVLNYAIQIAKASSTPIDLGDLTTFGLAFGEIAKGSQVGKTLSSEGKNARVNSQEVRYEGDSMNAGKDVVQEEKASEVETAVYSDEVDKGNHANIDEMGYEWDAAEDKSLLFKTPVANDKGNVNDANLNSVVNTWITTEDKSKQHPEMTAGHDDINPFATDIATKVDEDVNPVFNTGKHENISSVKPGLMNKVGSFGQEEDHLDIFFKRKTPWLHEEKPRFDEDRYSFLKVKPIFVEEKVSYHFDKKESSLQDNFVSEPVFDNVPERQSTFSEESSSLFKSPVFDDVYDEGPEPYDASFSFDDGLDKSTLSVGLSNEGPQSPPNIKAPPSFDLEPEPHFDKMVDEEEKFSMERKESTQKGQLRWQAKKPMTATGEKLGSSTSDASVGGASNPMSRRSRKQPQRRDDYEYESEMLAEGKSAADGGSGSQFTSKRPIGSSSSLTEKGSFRTKPVESFTYSSDAMNRRPSSSPKRVSSQQDHDSSEESQLDSWNSTSTVVGGRFPSIRTAKSPTRLAQQQKVAPEESDDEEYYFAEEKNQVGSSTAGSSVMGRTTKSPTRVAKQQLMAQGYDEVSDDAKDYKASKNSSRPSKLFQQDLVEDDSIDITQARYRPITQTEDLGNSESRYKPYGHINDVGKSNPSSRLPAGRRQQDLEEEKDLATVYKPVVQIDDLVKSSPSRPLSNRQQQKMHIEEEGPALASRYKPIAQDDDLGRTSSSPHWQRQQRHQKEQQEVFMEQQHEQEEFYSMRRPISGRRQHKISAEEVTENWQQRPIADRWQQQSLAEEEMENWQGQPISSRRQQQRLGEEEAENWQRRPISGRQQQQSLSEEEENWQQRPIPGRWQQQSLSEEEENWQQRPVPGRRQQQSLAKEEAENWQPRPISGRRQQQSLAKGEAENWQQRPISGRRKQQSLGEEEVENWQQRPIPGRRQQQSLVDEEAENWQQRPIPGRRQQQSLVDEEAENWQQRPIPGRRQQQSLVDEEAENWQQRPIPGRWQQQSLVDEEAENWQQRPIPGRRQQQSLAEEEAENWRQQPISNRLQQHSSEEEMTENWQQRPISGRRQQQSFMDEEAKNQQHQQRGREKRRSPSPSYRREQGIQGDKKSSELPMEQKELQQEEQQPHSMKLPKGQQEQVERVNEHQPPPPPLESNKLELKSKKEKSESWQQQEGREEQQDGPISGQQQQIELKEEGVKGQKEKPDVKTQPPARLPPSLPARPTSPLLEPSISDPIILATIPPPVKKAAVPPAPADTKLESAVSAPPLTSVPELKSSKVPQKPPNVDDLLANFEALKKARKGV